jgi:YesN/AraC family two-component response regulator
MLRTLIVEDELLARTGLRSLVDWKELGFELLEDAKDGISALEAIRKYQPKVILLDLNIPEISGLELMKILQKEKLQCSVVIISCYEDFETVKKAMQYGAVDYIRKLFMTKEELTSILLRIKKGLLEYKIEEGILLPMESKHHNIQGIQTDIKSLNELSSDLVSGSVICLYAQWISYTVDGPKILCEICSQILNDQALAFQIILEGDKLFVLLAEGVSGVETAQKLREQIVHFLPVEIYAGVSPMWTKSDKIEQALKLAFKTELLSFYNDIDKVKEIRQSLSASDECIFNFTKYREAFDAALADINQSEILSLIDALFQEIRSYKYISADVIKRVMIDVLSCFSNCAEQLGGAIEEIMVDKTNKHYQIIVDSRSLNELYNWFMAFIQRFVEKFINRSKAANSKILMMTLEYIEKNISFPIQLSSVAKYICVSESYLSSLFKREIGENFIPYVNKIKINEAKKMLDTGMLVYQVSEKLGFENSTYFSKVFKKYVGISPEVYRKKE